MRPILARRSIQYPPFCFALQLFPNRYFGQVVAEITGTASLNRGNFALSSYEAEVFGKDFRQPSQCGHVLARSSVLVATNPVLRRSHFLVPVVCRSKHK